MRLISKARSLCRRLQCLKMLWIQNSLAPGSSGKVRGSGRIAYQPDRQDNGMTLALPGFKLCYGSSDIVSTTTPMTSLHEPRSDHLNQVFHPSSLFLSFNYCTQIPSCLYQRELQHVMCEIAYGKGTQDVLLNFRCDRY